MRSVAIIPARGGSKRLPRKNISDFGGQPIIAYPIAAARESGCFDKIVVSTEDPQIAEIARRFGAEIDDRDAGLATDAATVIAVCLAFLGKERAAGRIWTQIACLYSTAALCTADDIRGTMQMLEPGLCDFAMTVSAYDSQPHLAMKFMPDKGLTPMWPDLMVFRASDLPPLRVSNGVMCAADVEALGRAGTFYGPGLRGFDMPRSRAVDIDTEQDLEFARWLALRARGEKT